MNNFRRIFCLITLTTLLLLPFIAHPVAANESHVGYSIEPHIPDNQIDKRQTYFNLLMEPGQQQELTVTVWNSTNEEALIKTSINNPISNENGLVDYTIQDAPLDESLEIPITDIAEIEENLVTIPANSSKDVTVSLEMPEEEWDGIILGGIYFEKVSDEKDQPSSVQIQNKYAYVVGLMLSQNDTEIDPELHLKSVTPKLVNYRPAIAANIQNSEALILKDLNIKAIVFTDTGKEIKKIERSDYSMAPNTNMDFIIDWENEELKPGSYTLLLEVEHEDSVWNWEEEFLIEAEEAEELNEEAVGLVKDYTMYINGGYSLIVFILIGIIIWLLRKLRKTA